MVAEDVPDQRRRLQPRDRALSARDLEHLQRVMFTVVAGRVPRRDVDDVVQTTWHAVLRALARQDVRDPRRFAARVACDACAEYHWRRARRHPARSLEAAAGTGGFGAWTRLSAFRVGSPSLGAIRAWFRNVVLPALVHADGDLGNARARRVALVRLIAENEGSPYSVKELARKLGCQPVQIRRDLAIVAESVKRMLAVGDSDSVGPGGDLPDSLDG